MCLPGLTPHHAETDLVERIVADALPVRFGGRNCTRSSGHRNNAGYKPDRWTQMKHRYEAQREQLPRKPKSPFPICVSSVIICG